MENPARVPMKTHISIAKQDITESRLPALSGGAQASGLDKAYEILLDALGFEPPSTNALVHRSGFSSQIMRSACAVTLGIRGLRSHCKLGAESWQKETSLR